MEAHDGRNLDDQRRRAADLGPFRGHNRFGATGQHQHDCAPFAHQLKWLKGGVQEKYSPHEGNLPSSPLTHGPFGGIDDGIGR